MNKFTKTIRTAALLGMFIQVSSALADDTDIYMANTDALTNPNILVLIDNSANWAANNQGWPIGKQGQSELNALRLATVGLGANVNLGLMMFSSGAVDGAYIRFGVRRMTPTNIAHFQQLIGTATCVDGLSALNQTPKCIYKNFSGGANNESINTASTDYSAAMFDVFKYFGGFTSPEHAFDDPPVAGTPVDSSHFGTAHYATLPDDITSGTTYTPLPAHKFDKFAYTASPDYFNYISPLSSLNSCAQNYLVVIGNGFPTQDSPASLLTGVGGDATQLPAPDFVTVEGDVQTRLSATPVAFASQAECELAALTTYASKLNNPYESFSCVSASASTVTTTLGTSSCGQYASATDCINAAPAAFPGYSSYSCDVAASCSGTQSLGTSACGLYASAAACEAALPSLYPGFSSFSCALSASTCTPSTVTLNTGTGNFAAGNYATAAACQAAAAIAYPGYSSYTCTGSGVSTTLQAPTACYASQAGCTSAVEALTQFSGYSAVSCATPVACTPVRKDICGGQNDYDTTAKCNALGQATWPSTAYATYACTNTGGSAPANWTGSSCSGSTNKYWIITGTNNSYTATGTGTAWTVTGTTTAGSRYDMTGTGGNTYTITTTNTETLWNTYGNNRVITSFPTGTFTTTSSNYADEWAKFLQETDVSAAPGQQTVTTYTIDVFKDRQDAEQTKLLMSMANRGGGRYFTATNENAIKMALQQIFAEIQSVNSVFASSSLPVSVNTQGTYLNQVFMGMFRPKANATPRWAGNLKQYNFKVFGGTMRLADKMGEEAISATTGFIAPCADSFWSKDTRYYWNYAGSAARGNCRAQLSAGGVTSFFSDAPDGDIVEKGGVAHRLRGVTLSGIIPVTTTNYLTRNLKTCDGTSAVSCTAFTPFNSTNTTLYDSVNTTYPAPAFGVPATSTATYQSTFIDWVRGKDVDDERVNTVLTEVRPSVHGGVVHSQPAVVDYGGTIGVVAFYGSDDGIFHAIDGGKTDAEGVEFWGFIAPEHYQHFHRLRDNGKTTPLIDLPGVTGSTAKKDYGFDGGIGVYQKASTVWIFPSMRRGGRAIYAFDVSNPTTPSIKWRKGCFNNDTANDSFCSAGWSSIGQTWSKPTVSYISGYSKPVLIFGGGYDTCEDYDGLTPYNQDPANPTYNSICTPAKVRKGANIWFVDADTGAIIRTYPTHYSVPGDLTMMTDAVGNVTHVYATDTGGYVYRINVGTYNGTIVAGAWSNNSAATDIDIADLSEAGQTRKFLYGPAVVKYSGFNAVLAGTGDREHPISTHYACLESTSITGNLGVQNRYYMLIDKPNTYPSAPATNTDLLDVTSSSSTTFDTATGIFTSASGATSTQGWRFDFGYHKAGEPFVPCEQAVNKGLVIAGIAYFGTNAPATSTTACETNLGVAYGYAVDFLTGNPANTNRSAVYTGGGMPPSPVAGVVDIDGSKQPFCIGCIDTTAANSSALQGSPVTINPTGSRFRSYWYIEND